jgi:hypothetical protein
MEQGIGYLLGFSIDWIVTTEHLNFKVTNRILQIGGNLL